MFDKWFAKYARAVSDDGERAELYKKFKVKTVVSIVFYALAVVLVVSGAVLAEYFEYDWALILIVTESLAWLCVGVIDLCLWLSFNRRYKEILNRPSAPDEMPEVTSYRQKIVGDKKASFKALWWVWIVFGMCIAAFFVCIVIDSIKNPDDEFGAWGIAAICILLFGMLFLMFAYIIYASSKQRDGKSIEQQTAREAKKIDAAQGRDGYSFEADENYGSLKYLFPDPELRVEAEKAVRRQSKILTCNMIAAVAISVIAVILFMCSELFGQNIAGYAFPATVTFALLWIVICTVMVNRKLIGYENEMKRKLKARPEYADHLKWYKINEDFSKVKGKLIMIFVLVGLAVGWVLAALYPASPISCVGLAPMVIGLFVHNRLVKGLRSQLIPVEKEIDEKPLALRNVKFCVRAGDADESTNVYFDGEKSGSVTYYLADKYACTEIEIETGRVVNFSSGIMILSSIQKTSVVMPENIETGNLFTEIDASLSDGKCSRIKFSGDEYYDEKNKIYLVGNIDGQRPCYKIFKNVYVQLSDDGELLCVLCTDIREK